MYSEDTQAPVPCTLRPLHLALAPRSSPPCRPQRYHSACGRHEGLVCSGPPRPQLWRRSNARAEGRRVRGREWSSHNKVRTCSCCWSFAASGALLLEPLSIPLTWLSLGAPRVSRPTRPSWDLCSGEWRAPLVRPSLPGVWPCSAAGSSQREPVGWG